MRISTSHTRRFLTATLALAITLNTFSALAKPPAKLVEPVVDPDAGEALPFEDVPGILRSARDWGLPPTVCYKHESIIDKTYASGDSCSSEKFFGFACGDKSTKIRRNKTWFEDYARRVEILQQQMTDPEKTIAGQKLAKFRDEGRKAVDAGGQPKGFLFYLENDSKERSQFRDLLDRAKNPKTPEDQTLQTKVDAKFKEGVQAEYGPKADAALRKLQDLMAPKDSLPGGVLDRQREAVLAAMKEQSTDLNSNFVRETFARMKKAVRDVDIDNSLAAQYCFPGQHNTFFIRGAGGGRGKIVICPATLLSDNPSELAGSIATALSHAIDSCAMDSMAAGTPAISLAGFLEPLRGCVAAKIARPKTGPAKNSFPEMTMPDGYAAIPVPESRRDDYNKAVQNSAGFQVQKGAPHCPAPLTSDELGKMTQFKGKEQVITDSSGNLNVQPRDQSNDAVAQFFADKAIAGYINADPRPDKKVMLTEALAPYCDAFYNERGPSAPAQEVLNKLMASDPDISEMVCGSAKGASGSAGKERRASDALAQSYFTGKSAGAVAAKSCDSMLAKGAAAYVGMFPNMAKWGGGAALSFNPSVVALGGASGPGGGSASPVGGGTPAGGSSAGGSDAGADAPGDGSADKPGDKGDGAGSALPSVTDYSATSTLASQLNTREQAIDVALDSEKANCRNIVNSGQFPFTAESELLTNNQTCQSAVANRVDLNLFVPPHERDAVAPGATNSSYKIKIGCQSRCSCDPARCYFPEPVYLGMVADPNPKPNKNAITIAADIAHYLRDDETKGRYGIAAKECLKWAPVETGKAIANGCASDSAARDPQHRLIISPETTVALLGEASGALLNFGCEYHCSCGDPKGCRVLLKPPVIAGGDISKFTSASADDYAKARAGNLGKDASFTYLASLGVNVPLHVVGVGSVGSSGGGGAGDSGPGSASGNIGSGALTGVPAQDWNRYEAAKGKTDSIPKPSEVLASRNISRVQSDKTALSACRDPGGALTSEYNAKKKRVRSADPKNKVLFYQSKYEYFCPDKAASPPVEFPSGPVTSGVVGTKTDEYTFQYKCLYSCADGVNDDERATVRYVGQTPPTEKIAPLKTPADRERARLADFALYRDRLDTACTDAVTPTPQKYPDPKSLEIVKASVKSKVTFSCANSSPVKTAGNLDIEETTTFATNFTGDLSQGPLPYSCTYTCDCKTNTCSLGKAVLVSPKNGADLSQVPGLNKSPPGALVVVDPTPEQVDKYKRVATSKCLEQGMTVTGAEVACKKDGVPGKGPDVLLAGSGNIWKFACMYPCVCKGKVCTADTLNVVAAGPAAPADATPVVPVSAVGTPDPGPAGGPPVIVPVVTGAAPVKDATPAIPAPSDSAAPIAAPDPAADKVGVDPVAGPEAPMSVDPDQINPAVWADAADKCRNLPNPSPTLFAASRLLGAANGCNGPAAPPQPLLTDDTVTAFDAKSKGKYEFQCRYMCTCNLLKEFRAGAGGGKKICLPMPADKPRAAVALVKLNDKSVVLSSEGSGPGVGLGAATAPPPAKADDGKLEPVLKAALPNAKLSKSYADAQKKMDYYRSDTDNLLGLGDKTALCTSNNPLLDSPETKINTVYLTRACVGKKDGDPTRVEDVRAAQLATKSPNGSYRYTCSPAAVCKGGKAVIKPAPRDDADYDFDVSFPYLGACQKVMFGQKADCSTAKEQYEMNVVPQKGTTCNYTCFCNAERSASRCDLAGIKK